MGADSTGLGQPFLDAAPAKARAELRALPDLEGRLRALLADGEKAHPGFAIPAAEFMRYLAERLPAAAPERALPAVLGADLYLACGCARGVRLALAAFEARVLPRMDAALRRLDPSAAFVDEVKQLLRQKLLLGDGPGDRAKILDYEGRGPLEGWVRAAAIRTGLNLHRGVRPDQVSEDTLLELPSQGMDPELQAIKRRYQAEFKQCFKDAMAAVPVEDRNLLRLYLLEGAGVAEIAKLHRVHRTTITRRLAQSRNALVQETRRLLVERLRLGRPELDTMVELLRSQLDLSISRVLR